MLQRAIPILPARDVERAPAFYATLGFGVRAYEGGGYGYATRDGVELHLGQLARPAAHLGVPPRRRRRMGNARGALVDPDDNVLRFGSPLGT